MTRPSTVRTTKPGGETVDRDETKRGDETKPGD
jgi:hypothetical protein